MANLIVTFTRLAAGGGSQLLPLEHGSAARTEEIEIAAANTAGEGAAGDLTAAVNEPIVRLKAKAECWVAVGPDAVATVAGVDCRHFDLDEIEQFGVSPGDRVSVVAV